jgi:hypothetical protein
MIAGKLIVGYIVKLLHNDESWMPGKVKHIIDIFLQDQQEFFYLHP